MTKKLIDCSIYQFVKKFFPSVNLNTWLGVYFKVRSLMPLTKKEHDLWEKISSGIPYDHKKYVVPQNVAVVGSRRIGKSLKEGIILDYNALTFDLPLIAGNTARNAILCPTVQAGMPPFDYCAGLIESNEALAKFLVPSQPWQNPIVKNRQQALMRFANRTSIEVIAPTILSARGLTLKTLCLDEVAHHSRNEGSAFCALELYKASAPALATFGAHSEVVADSTPYDKSDLLWQVYKKFFGKPNENWLVLQIPVELGALDISTGKLTIDESFLRQQQDADPAWYAREFGAEFMSDVPNAALNVEALTDSTVNGRYQLAYNPSFKYFGFLRPSSLSTPNDEYVCGIAHTEDGDVVIDSINAWTQEQDDAHYTPDDCLNLSIQLFRSYKVLDVEADKFAYGLEYKLKDARFNFLPCRLAKSDLYLHFQEVLNSRKVRLLDDDVAFNQLKTLQLQRSNTGRDRINPGQEKKHDERAQTICGLVYMSRSRMSGNRPFNLSDIKFGRAESSAPSSSEIFGEPMKTNFDDWF